MMGTLLVVVLGLVLAPLVGLLVFKTVGYILQMEDVGAALRDGNRAVALIMAACVLANGLVLREVLQPSWNALMYVANDTSGLIDWLSILGMQLVVAQVGALLGMASMLVIFSSLTSDLDERAEVAKGADALGLVLASGVLLSGLLMADAVAPLLDALVPYPDAQLIELAE